MRIVHKSIPDRSQPGLTTTASGVAQQGTCRNYATAKHTVIKTSGEREEEGKCRSSGKCGKEEAHS